MKITKKKMAKKLGVTLTYVEALKKNPKVYNTLKKGLMYKQVIKELERVSEELDAYEYPHLFGKE